MEKVANDLQKKEENILNSLMKVQNRIEDISIFMERIDVMLCDISQEYFGQRLEGMKDAWKIMPPYYNTARVKTEITHNIFFELKDNLEQLQQEVCEISLQQKMV